MLENTALWGAILVIAISLTGAWTGFSLTLEVNRWRKRRQSRQHPKR